MILKDVDVVSFIIFLTSAFHFAQRFKCNFIRSSVVLLKVCLGNYIMLLLMKSIVTYTHHGITTEINSCAHMLENVLQRKPPMLAAAQVHIYRVSYMLT